MSIVDNLISYISKKEINQNIIKLLELKTKTITSSHEYIYDFFFDAIKLDIKVNDVHTHLPIYIQELLKKETIEEKDISILKDFRNTILNVKIQLFQNIENNKNEFKTFKELMTPYLSDNNEYNAQFLCLSFFLKSNNTQLSLEECVETTKTMMESGYFNTLLPSTLELELITSFDNEFTTGLECEFWLSPSYIKDKRYGEEAALKQLDVIMKYLIDEDNTINHHSMISDTNESYQTSEVIKEDVGTIHGAKPHYCEIVTKKFDTLSEMLVFNDFLLNVIDNLEIKKSEEIKVSSFNEKKKLQIQEETYDEYPGSFHFNISLNNIEKINRIKFILFLEDTGIMNEWYIRNQNVKEIKPLLNMFGPLVIETSLFDKFWQVNFKNIDEPDKTGKMNPRVEIRYFGGKLYSQKKEEILSNIISIVDCVNISMDNSNNDTYLMLFKNWDVDKEFNSLKREERDYLEMLFKTKNPIIIEKKFNKIKQEIEELRNKYNIGER